MDDKPAIENYSMKRQVSRARRKRGGYTAQLTHEYGVHRGDKEEMLHKATMKKGFLKHPAPPKARGEFPDEDEE